MTRKRIFITGASGCVGHYVADTLMRETDHELFLLARNPSRLRVNTGARPGVTVLPGDMRHIGQFADLLKTMHVAVLAAVDWGGTHAFYINVAKTVEVLDLLDPAVCEQALYFSTSSILDRNNQPIDEAGEIGTDYIRSKYDLLRRLPDLTIAPRVTILFPTTVLGGDEHKPRSFLSDSLPALMKWIDLVRFFRADAGFHFIHAHDIAQVVHYLVEHPAPGAEPRSFVLGQAPLTLNEALEEICAYLDKRIYFRVPVPIPLARLLLMLAQRRIPYRDRLWDRFCLDHRDFRHANPINPASFGLPSLCATLTDVLQVAGIPRGAGSSPVRGIPQADGSEDRPR
ncbi:MAG: NAD-dependent epimerase/dehydratase family protein [Armatimonadota bacterium]